MGQLRKAIFIGRDAPDTGLDAYCRLARLKRITLDIFTHTPDASKYLPQYDVAFVSSYLAIVEALAAGVPVLAYYHNELKKDYLLLAPFADFIDVFSDPKQAKIEYNLKRIRAGKKWASEQTWDKVTDLYEKLWRK